MRNFNAGLMFMSEDKVCSLLCEFERPRLTDIQTMVGALSELVIIICVEEYIVTALTFLEHPGEGKVEEFLVSVVGDDVYLKPIKVGFGRTINSCNVNVAKLLFKNRGQGFERRYLGTLHADVVVPCDKV